MFKNVTPTYLFPTVSTFVGRHTGFIAACWLFCILPHSGFACQRYDRLESNEGLEVGCHSLFCYTPHDRLMRTFLVPSLGKKRYTAEYIFYGTNRMHGEPYTCIVLSVTKQLFPLLFWAMPHHFSMQSYGSHLSGKYRNTISELFYKNFPLHKKFSRSTVSLM